MQENKVCGLIAADPLMKVEDIPALLQEVGSYGAGMLCLPPIMISHARAAVKDQKIRLAALIGYPFGSNATESKLAEMVLAIVNGADELVVCANITAIRNNDWQYIARELGALMPVARNKQKRISILTELAWLSDEDIVRCSDMFGVAGIDAIITGTGLCGPLPDTNRIITYRKHLAEAIPLYVVADGSGPFGNFIHDGATGIIVKSVHMPHFGQQEPHSGTIFEKIHQN